MTEKQQLIALGEEIDDLIAMEPTQELHRLRQSVQNALEDITHPAGKENARMAIAEIRRKLEADTFILPPPPDTLKSYEYE